MLLRLMSRQALNGVPAAVAQRPQVPGHLLETHGALSHLPREDALLDRAVVPLLGGRGRRLDADGAVARGEVLAEVLVLGRNSIEKKLA